MKEKETEIKRDWTAFLIVWLLAAVVLSWADFMIVLYFFDASKTIWTAFGFGELAVQAIAVMSAWAYTQEF